MDNRYEIVWHEGTHECAYVVDITDIASLAAAMLMKSQHIKAYADPEIFEAAAKKLERLWLIENGYIKERDA